MTDTMWEWQCIQVYPDGEMSAQGFSHDLRVFARIDGMDHILRFGITEGRVCNAISFMEEYIEEFTTAAAPVSNA